MKYEQQIKQWLFALDKYHITFILCEVRQYEMNNLAEWLWMSEYACVCVSAYSNCERVIQNNDNMKMKRCTLKERNFALIFTEWKSPSFHSFSSHTPYSNACWTFIYSNFSKQYYMLKSLSFFYRSFHSAGYWRTQIN